MPVAFIQDCEYYYLGVVFAVMACVAMGVMCVMGAKNKGVSVAVLANWSSIFGLIMGVIYWILDRDNAPLLKEMSFSWVGLVGTDSI